MKPIQKEKKATQDDKITFADFTALVIALFQLIYPFVLISIAVFVLLMWLLTKFWA